MHLKWSESSCLVGKSWRISKLQLTITSILNQPAYSFAPEMFKK